MTNVADRKENAFGWTKSESQIVAGSVGVGLGFASLGLMSVSSAKLGSDSLLMIIMMAVIVLCFATGIPRLIKGTMEMLRPE